MFKRIFFHGICAGALSALAAVVYNHIYFFATEADYSKIINTGSITGLSFMICLVATFIYYGLQKWLKTRADIVFNFVFSIVSYACVMVPISISLPLDVKLPELFPGLAVPMVFFPVLAWYTLKPLFTIK